MSKAILLLKNQKPAIIHIADCITSLCWTLPDGTDDVLEIITAFEPSRTGDSTGYRIATNIDDLSLWQIMDAVDIVKQQ